MADLLFGLKVADLLIGLKVADLLTRLKRTKDSCIYNGCDQSAYWVEEDSRLMYL